MTAVVKKIGEKRGFEIPTVDEVKDYILSKKGWPERFCQYYAERFWNFYQSNGWKVSGRAAMKDWQAAFNSQWQHLKFQDDKDYLAECLKVKPMEVTRNDNWLNELLNQYKVKFESVTDEKLIRAYDFMKEHKLIKMSPEDVRLIRASYGDNINKGKSACVKMIFTNMINYGKTFN